MVLIFPYAVNRNRLEQAMQRLAKCCPRSSEDLDTRRSYRDAESARKTSVQTAAWLGSWGAAKHGPAQYCTQMEQTLRLVFDRVTGVPAMLRPGEAGGDP